MQRLRGRLQEFVKENSSEKKLSGFTIIEVLIVLAIAGLIVILVFLAFPTLQRNSRNNQRTNDAAKIVSAVIECLANSNALAGSCNDQDELSPNFIDITNNNQLTSINVSETYSQDAAGVVFGRVCNTAGTDSLAGGGNKTFTITYQLEPDINKCVGS